MTTRHITKIRFYDNEGYIYECSGLTFPLDREMSEFRIGENLSEWSHQRGLGITISNRNGATDGRHGSADWSWFPMPSSEADVEARSEQLRKQVQQETWRLCLNFLKWIVLYHGEKFSNPVQVILLGVYAYLFTHHETEPDKANDNTVVPVDAAMRARICAAENAQEAIPIWREVGAEMYQTLQERRKAWKAP